MYVEKLFDIIGRPRFWPNNSLNPEMWPGQDWGVASAGLYQGCIGQGLHQHNGLNKKLTKSKISVITHHHLSIDHIGFDNLKLFCIWNFNESAQSGFQEVQSNTYLIISTQFGCPLQRTTVAYCL